VGLNRPWDQFGPTDRPLELPLYQGRIDPTRWNPAVNHPPTTLTGVQAGLEREEENDAVGGAPI
jgi:hypothetical protein